MKTVNIQEIKLDANKKIKAYLIMLIFILSLPLIRGHILNYVLYWLMTWFVYKLMGHAKKEQKKQVKEFQWQEPVFVSVNKVFHRHKLNYVGILLPFIMLYIILYTEFISYEMSMLSSLHLLVSAILAISILYQFNRYSRYYLQIYMEGFIHQGVSFAFEDIKKYQFIKKRKGGYLFEVNNGKQYTTITIDDAAYAEMIKYLD